MQNLSLLTLKIKNYARLLGFDAVGITHAEPLTESEKDLKLYIQENRQGSMSWLAKTVNERPDPKAYIPEARVIIMVAMNYFRKYEISISPPGYGTISIYARGRDYHRVLRNKLKKFYHWICEQEPTCQGRIFVDSFPLMEKPLAVRAGLGWIGKNTTLLLKGKGSYFFLGGIILNLELVPDSAFNQQFCGSCRNCLIACPTGALDKPFQLDSRKCISYLTIEHKGEIENYLQEKMSNMIFGCDICQMVCPWNQRFATTTPEKDFKNRFKKQQMLLSKLSRLSRHEYEKIFEGTPVRRGGFDQFLRNIEIAIKNYKSDSHSK